MVRQCAIPGCKNNDQVTLCHRFPKRKEFLEKWRNSLALGVDPVELFNRYVVCTQHFQASDYRNSASRMLNLMAVPSLNFYRKGEFYDPPTTAQNGVNHIERAQVQWKVNEEKKEPEPVLEASEIEVLEIQHVEPESSMTVEIIEPVDEEFEVFYIEEEVKEQTVEKSLQLEVLEEHPIDKTMAPPPVKRKYIQDELQSSPSKTILHDVATQTNYDEKSSAPLILEQRSMAEKYPEYAKCSRLELAKELKETSEQLAGVKKRLAHIEAAHAVVREAFKSIIN